MQNMFRLIHYNLLDRVEASLNKKGLTFSDLKNYDKVGSSDFDRPDLAFLTRFGKDAKLPIFQSNCLCGRYSYSPVREAGAGRARRRPHVYYYCSYIVWIVIIIRLLYYYYYYCTVSMPLWYYYFTSIIPLWYYCYY